MQTIFCTWSYILFGISRLFNRSILRDFGKFGEKKNKTKHEKKLVRVKASKVYYRHNQEQNKILTLTKDV